MQDLHHQLLLVALRKLSLLQALAGCFFSHFRTSIALARL
jgi:hypothetical protein